MEYRQLGASGFKVLVLSLGTGGFGGSNEFFRGIGSTDVQEAMRLVDVCLEAGLCMFDSADAYSGGRAEEILGRAIAGRRDRVILSTKATFRTGSAPNDFGSSRYHLIRSVEGSLKRLGSDYIDLYQLHRPDPEVPIADTLGALDELKRAGKVREIGCSNFSVEQIREAEGAVKPGAARFVSVQNEYSLLKRDPERGVLAECAARGIGFLPYFPLASGLLTGKYARTAAPPPASARLADASAPMGTRFRSDRNVQIAEELRRFASGRGHSLLELAFSWLLAQPAVSSVIAGATSPEQIRANAAAAAWRLSSDELGQIDRLAPLGASS